MKIIAFIFVLSYSHVFSQWSQFGALNTSPLTTGGFVGIGKSIPTNKLQVSSTGENDNASIGIDNDFARPSIIFSRNRDDYYPHIFTKWMLYPAGIDIESPESIFQIMSNTGGIYNYSLSIKSSNGYIGLNNSNPEYRLHLKSDNVDDNTGIKIENDFARPSIVFSRNPNTTYYEDVATTWMIYPAGVDPNSPESIFQIVGKTGTNYIFPFTISSDGRVKIGERQPQGNFANYKLAVDGKIVATEIQVIANNSTNWADHVFKKDYKLTPLSEVAAFIKKNKHLPEIPSENEIRENGINLAEMQKLQMQKIEELTLYIIQQQKEIKKLHNLLLNAKKK